MGGNVSLIDGHIDRERTNIIILENALAMARGEKAVLECRIKAMEAALKKARERK